MIPVLRMLLAMWCIQCRAGAALEADFVTSRGTVTVQLEYQKAPKAVANFLTLGSGTRSWREPASGAVHRKPFYNGLKFTGVVNTVSEKLAETGLLASDGETAPGFSFQDEFDASLTHAAYVLAMANEGPNTNGSRIYFTGGTPLAVRDNRNTVFGKVLLPASRSVVDAIISAGPNATSVTSVTFRRTDAGALAFDENAVPLPRMRAVNGPLQVQPGSSTRLLFTQPAFSMLKSSSSTDLAAWEYDFQSFTALDQGAAVINPVIGLADTPAMFHLVSLAEYPAVPVPGGPAGFGNRILTIEGGGVGTIVYQFNASGTGGTYQNFVFPGDPPFFTGSFQVRPEIPARFDAYSFRVLVRANGLGGSPFNLIRGGVDTVGSGAVLGRHQTTLMDESMNTVFEESGSLVITRP